MTSTPALPTGDSDAPTQGRTDLGQLAVVIMAVMALVFSFVGFVVDDTRSDTVGAAGPSAPVPVAMSEFALNPTTVSVPLGGSLAVTNAGGQIHNLMIEGTDLITPDLSSGGSAVLDLSSLEAGEYTMLCDIAGHKEAGMTGTVIVGADSGSDGGDSHGGHGATDDVDWVALDDAMLESVRRFPAETEGVGNQVLEPEILPDGTKRFELTAQIVDWEVEPGRFVEAWTYNGMVPGPWIKVDVGDQVQVHVTNELPGGTDVHWHGIRVPFEMDGLSPITQDLIRSGEDFLYEFTADRTSVGMYHAHHMGHTQVPNGMLGVIQIGDVDLPRGQTIGGVAIPADLEIAQELPMVLNDAGTIGLSLNGKGFPATAPLTTRNGDWVLVHYFNEGLQVHPMHQHQFPQLIVAKDGMPLDHPYWADTVNVAPGERYSVLIHTDDPGTWVWHCHILTHVEREEGMFGMVTAMVVAD